MNGSPALDFAVVVVVIGGALWVVHMLLAIAKELRNFFVKKEPAFDDRAVTRAELADVVQRFSSALARMEADSEKQHTTFDTRLARIDKYATDNVHELRGLMQNLNSTVTVIQVEMTKVLQATVTTIAARLDKAEGQVSSIVTSMQEQKHDLHEMKSAIDRLSAQTGS